LVKLSGWRLQFLNQIAAKQFVNVSFQHPLVIECGFRRNVLEREFAICTAEMTNTELVHFLGTSIIVFTPTHFCLQPTRTAAE